MNDRILQKLKENAAVPAMPQIVTRFLEVVRDPIFSYDNLVDVLSADPGLVADILRMANCAFFGVSREITSLHQATTLLGIKRIRSLVLGRFMLGSLNGRESGIISQDDYWHRSVTCGVVGARLAAITEAGLRDEAMISGLLTLTGVIVMDAGISDEYKPVAETFQTSPPEQYAERERAQVHVDHATLSAAIMEEWQLPPLIIQAIRHQFCDVPPKSLSEQQIQLATILKASADLAWLIAGQADDACIKPVCAQASELLGITNADLVSVFEELPVHSAELAELLHVRVIPSTRCDELCAALSTDHVIVSHSA